ncbi:unknown [Ruminococcus sp. CAG:382]|nr:unknown [Ruminococcus sp. CAG:382]
MRTAGAVGNHVNPAVRNARRNKLSFYDDRKVEHEFFALRHKRISVASAVERFEKLTPDLIAAALYAGTDGSRDAMRLCAERHHLRNKRADRIFKRTAPPRMEGADDAVSRVAGKYSRAVRPAYRQHDALFPCHNAVNTVVKRRQEQSPAFVGGGDDLNARRVRLKRPAYVMRRIAQRTGADIVIFDHIFKKVTQVAAPRGKIH